jgi:DNA-binding CsgD family transcriptional regulator
LLPVIDGLVRALLSLRPTVLVVDDMHWADVATRDAITYLVAGFSSQRLAVLATYRDEELAAGHPMHVWLADLLRFPSVSSLPLARMCRDETEEQLSSLLGGRPSPRLVAEVVRHSDGNPYFSELLVQGLTTADEDLPADLPGQLTGALLAAWHCLSEPSREVVRLLAVGGRPAAVDDLIEVAAAGGMGAETVRVALVEATNTGICVSQSTDSDVCWFRHPLLADVLDATFVPGEAVPIHAAWAKTLERRSGAGIGELQRVSDLAVHYEGAHHPGACLEASLRAADLARQLKALPEEEVHLRRAACLLPVVAHDHTQPVPTQLDLFERLGILGDLLGDGGAAFSALSRALELVDQRADPLRASRILRKHAWVSLTTGRRTGEPFDACEQAVKLCEPFPDSAEYAMALADLSGCHSWTDSSETGQRPYAEEAVRAALRSGSHEALALAYIARATASIRDQRANSDTLESVRHARMQSDPNLLANALMVRFNYLWVRGRLAEAIDLEADALHEVLDTGAVDAAGYMAGAHARSLLILGRFPEADLAIRDGLTLARTPQSRVQVRLAAASLSMRRGDITQARVHLQRANELMPDLEVRPSLYAPPTLAEYLIASGRPKEALKMVARTLAAQIVDPRIVDEMLVWGARAAADLAEHTRDRRDSAGVIQAQRLLADIVRRRQRLQPRPFEVVTTEDQVLPAIEALYKAESARCLSQSPTSAMWEEAAHRCAVAGLRWEEAAASGRWAQALLAEGASGTVVAVPLRSAYRLAVSMSADPLRQQVETLATLGKIVLDEPPVPSIDAPEVFGFLTRREREVLAYLVAGRTYAEIANALFISQKTVSAHVSNLLRKTGTSSRREVAALAIRLGFSGDRRV